MKFYDTNALLALQNKAFGEKFAISQVTLRELENIKTSAKKDPEVKYRARKLTHLLNDHYGEYLVADYSEDRDSPPLYGEDSHDYAICYDAMRFGCGGFSPRHTFVTDDVSCRNIARSIYGMAAEAMDSGSDEFYKGYKKVRGDSESINKFMESIQPGQFHVNEYLILENTETGKATEMRYTENGFVALKLPESKFIKGKNSLQRCALDLLNNKDIPIVSIMGCYGSGKTFLATQASIYQVKHKGNQSRILGVREPKGEGAQIGYLAGSFQDKTKFFFLPLEQQLEGGMFELNELMQRGVLETNIPYYMKGTTYRDAIILVDEAEDLSESQLRLVGTRLGEGSRVFFSGDYSQSIQNKSMTNPLVKMCEELKGQPLFGCICLDDDVRSSASKLFANLFK